MKRNSAVVDMGPIAVQLLEIKTKAATESVCCRGSQQDAVKITTEWLWQINDYLLINS